jgi:gas vesicle structural protein
MFSYRVEKRRNARVSEAKVGYIRPVAIATRGTASNYLQRAPSPSGLADVLDVILDKGLVIDAYVRVSVIGIEVLTIDARVVIASVDTYLRFAEAVNRLDLTETELAGLPELQKEGAKHETEGAIEGAEEKIEPDTPAVRKALKGVAAGAAAAGVAAAAKKLADHIGPGDGDAGSR